MQRPRTAMYLLRFDDLCPTMNWKVWAEIESALAGHQIKPILAVVPDNRDPALKVEPAVADFWERVRQWQARGWTIGLHGFQHKYVGKRRGIVTPVKNTEFAGVPAAKQAKMLRRGVEIFQREGIRPRVWVAPSNSFDAATVSLLPQFGVRIISDGYFRFPFRWPKEMLWLPQQLFGFRPAPSGIWTVCYHHNDWTTADLDQFRRDLDRYGDKIGSVDEAIHAWPARTSLGSSLLSRNYHLSTLLTRCQLKLAGWWARQCDAARLIHPRQAEQSR